MKKKILLTLFVFVAVFALTGCTNEEKKYTGENAFDNYTGIFRNGNAQIKLVNVDEGVKFKYKKNVNDEMSSVYNDINFLEGNKIGNEEYEMEFSKDSIKVTVKAKDTGIVEGEYKRYANYTAEEIFIDNHGFDFVKDGKFNNLYTFDNNKLYVVDVDEKTVRAMAISDSAQLTINFVSKGDNKYAADLYGTEYNIVFNDDTVELTTNSDNEDDKTLVGTYKKESSLTIKDAIKAFFND